MRKKIISIVLCLMMCMAVCAPSINAADYYSMSQVKYVKVDPTDPNNASVIFSPIPQTNKLSFIDGQTAGRYDELYSEQVEFGGIPGRQVYVENKFYFTFEDGFANKNDSVFAFIIDYWDYGGGGYFHVEYTTKVKGEVARASILKLGLDENGVKTAGGWHRVTLYVDDACFDHSLDYGTDFRLISNAYNTFSRIEVRNVSQTMKPDEDFGVFNGAKATSLNYLQMFDGYGEGEEFDPKLDKVFTREEFYVQMIKSYALGETALSENRKTRFTDVSQEAAPYIGYAEKIGVIKKAGNTLGASDTVPQKEMIAAYLRLLGVPDDNLEDNAIKLGLEYGLINPGSMIFQPEKPGNVDVFVTLAMNVFSMSNLNTGESAFGKLFDTGFYTEKTLLNAKDKALNNWLLENIFTLNGRTLINEDSRREYHEIDFFGQNALKEYYTQNCMSTDNRYIAFRDGNMNLYLYEIATDKTKFVGKLLKDYVFMITPKNNLWYTDKDWNIVKVPLTDVDIKTDDFTYEIMGRIPEWQTRQPGMMQVNNAETRISYEWRDTKGDFDPNYYSRIPIYKIDEQEWDIDHWWGFISNWYYPNHVCVNPAYDNLAFFAHEWYHPNGTPQYDRVWAVDMDTDEYYNAIPQKAYRWDNDILGDMYYSGENLVHEAWSNDGEWIMAVKNVGTMDGISRGIGLAGAVMVRPDGTDKRYVPVTYEYTLKNKGGASGATICHCMLSNTTDRWLVGDSQYGRGFSDLYLIDTYTGADYFLGRFPLKDNPGHIHPQFSMDDTKVIFGHQSDDNSHVEIGWMDVSDIVFSPLDGGKYDLSETCDTFGYNGFEHYIIPDKDANGEIKGFRIPRNNKMNVNVKREVVENDKVEADITITFLDEGSTPIKILYNTWDNNVGGYGKLTEREVYIERKNSGQFVTKTVHFDDINLGNMYALGVDFKIYGVSTEAYIKSVDVYVPDEYKVPVVNKKKTPPTAAERR